MPKSANIKKSLDTIISESKSESPEPLNLKNVLLQINVSEKNAAKNLDFSIHPLKKFCRKNHIKRWPFRQVNAQKNKLGKCSTEDDFKKCKEEAINYIKEFISVVEMGDVEKNAISFEILKKITPERYKHLLEDQGQNKAEAPLVLGISSKNTAEDSSNNTPSLATSPHTLFPNPLKRKSPAGKILKEPAYKRPCNN